jgi:hypothetical protein
MTYTMREEWLVALVEALRPVFTNKGYEIPACPISCGWPSKSIRKTLGQCWLSTTAKDGSRAIFVSPKVANAAEVAGIVVHELLHACLPDGTGHKAPFKKGMKALGLEGKATATEVGPELAERLNVICKDLGEYPHAALSLSAQMPKQGTRMLKLLCPGCGYTARTTAKWIDAGLPTCCCGEEFQLEEK